MMKRMNRFPRHILLAVVLFAGLLRIPASAQHDGIDEATFSGTWSKTNVIATTNIYAAITMDWLSLAPVIYGAKAGGGLERWEESAGWVQNGNPGNAGYTNNVYSSLAGHVADQNQAYGANAAGGIDRIYTAFTLWYTANIFGAGTVYSAVGMDRQTGTAILYAAPAAGNVQRWFFTTSWGTSGNIVTNGTVYNDLVGDPTANDSLYGVSTNGGIDSIYYDGFNWQKSTVAASGVVYRTIAADRETNNPTLYAGLPNGGVHRWYFNGSSWTQTVVLTSECVYRSLVGSTPTSNQFYGAATPPPPPPPPPDGMILTIR